MGTTPPSIRDVLRFHRQLAMKVPKLLIGAAWAVEVPTIILYWFEPLRADHPTLKAFLESPRFFWVVSVVVVALTIYKLMLANYELHLEYVTRADADRIKIEHLTEELKRHGESPQRLIASDLRRHNITTTWNAADALLAIGDRLATGIMDREFNNVVQMILGESFATIAGKQSLENLYRSNGLIQRRPPPHHHVYEPGAEFAAVAAILRQRS